MEKNLKKKTCMYVWITPSLCCTPETLNQLYFNLKQKKNCAVRNKIMEERLEEMQGKNNFLMGDSKAHLCSAGNELV